MKEFFVGLIFLILVFVLAGVAILMTPLLLVLGIFLRILIYVVFVIFAIWLLGKLIILIWESIRSKPEKK